jgi:molybdopterin adenylyltransferase
MGMVRVGVLQITTGDFGLDEEMVGSVVVLLRQALPALVLVRQESMSSERYLIEEVLRRWCDEEEIDLLLTIGGTFPSPGSGTEEIVPEATQSILERLMPSLPETMRAYALEEDLAAILDRGVAGIRGRTLVINLPQGPQLSLLFLQGIADLLELVLDRIQPISPPDALSSSAVEPMPEEPAPLPQKRKRGLDPDEFAAFLRKRGREQ